MKTVEVHSKLSPSASSRWMHCAGSVAVNQGGGYSSFYAREGTAAHALFEMCIRIGAEPHDFLGHYIHEDFAVTDDMVDAVGQALDYIRSYVAKHPKSKVNAELKVDPARLLKCDNDLTSGTLDCSIDNAPTELVMIDYKHGAGVGVEADDNTQLLQYALGYVSQYATHAYAQYRLIIIQPRHRHEDGPVREVVLTHTELMAHAAKVRKRVAEIARNPDKRVAGKWCRFCAAQGRCKALAAESFRAAAMEFKDKAMKKKPVDPQELDPEELAHALDAWHKYIESWGKALYAAAHKYLLEGGELEGYKLVRGNSARYWENEKKVLSMLLKRFKFDIDDVMPRSMIGVPKVEQLFRGRITVRGGKKDPLPPVLKPLIGRSKPTIQIARDTDPRPAVARGEEFTQATENSVSKD